MFKGNKSKKLAFFAAMALVGGAFAPYTYAADVTINPSHPPVKNVPRPLTTGAAGGVGTDGADASGNTLTIRDYDYENNAVYGGAALGTGNAERNTLTVVNSKVLLGYGGAAQNGGNANHNKLVFRSGEVGVWMAGGLVNSETGSAEGNSVTVHNGTTSHIYGGYSKKAKARGNVHRNEVAVNGGTIDGKIKGGVIDEAKSTGNVTENTVTINGGTVKDAVYGGAIEKSNSTGTAAGNRVTINGGIIQKDIIGGFVRGKGTLTGNIVTIAGGEIEGEIYAAFSDNSKSVLTDNVVNLGDGEHAAPVNVSKFVWVARGRYGATSSGNTLNVKTRAEADSVGGFEKLNFYFKEAIQPKLTLRKSMDLKIASLNDIGVYGSPQMKSGTLIEKERGKIKIKDSVTSATVTGDTAEMTLRLDSTEKKLDYTRLIFKGATVAESEGSDTWGGRSTIGNTTTENAITIDSGSHTNVYGGWTTGTGSTAAAERRGNSTKNTVTITGGTIGTVYGGFTDVVNGTTHDNTVNLGDGAHPLAPATTIVELYGGNRTATGNTLNVNTAATVGRIENFSTVAFKNASSKLTLTQAGAHFDLDAIQADFAATENPITLVHNEHGLTLMNYTGKVKSTLSVDGTRETNIDVIETAGRKTDIVRYGYMIKDARAATTLGTDTWGGRSRAGNTTTGNAITIDSGTHTNVYGGWTTGTGSTAPADKRGDSTKNSVTIKDNAVVTHVYGGFTDVAGGRAEHNIVSLKDVTVTGTVTGGRGTVTSDNVIRLRNAKVTGLVTGGTGHGTGNTLAVYYSTGTSEIGDFDGIQNLHFDLESAPPRGAHTLLKLTAVGGDKHLVGMKIDFHRDGAAQKFAPGDQITLMENTNGRVSLGENVTVQGTDGISRDYTFDVVSEGNTLIGRVAQVTMNEQSKSIVETRAGASAFLNDCADFTAGPGMDAAKKEARAAVQSGSAPYGIWAGMGGGSLRHETGSYVDMKGWNLGVGWARENAVQAGTLTFGPFIEYGRGSYDSYLDDGTHGSGKTSYVGAGMMARLETAADNWIDSSLRIGRTKSDYTGLANYDTTSTYYGVQVGVGKDFHVSENDTVGAYVRYAYAHTAGTSAHLSSGETFDFDAVNSHRLRIGTRYTHGATALSQFYAGLAWEYEFDGDARATSQGDSAPSPSLKGGSALLELGYRFAPQGSRMSYDLNLNGWQGKRKGVTGGVSVKWAF